MIRTNKIIEIKNVTKFFGNILANSNISFNIHESERIGIIGANGSGKTTLVEQIIGVSKPTQGEIIYNFDFIKSPQEQMGMQFQDSSYPEGLSVKDVVEFSINIYGVNITKKKLNDLLDIFQIKDFYKAKAKSLSGGQQQKLNVLLAMAHNPKIIILDEISTGLDISARKEILSHVDKITRQEKTTTILISHNMSEIELFCDRVIILKNGKIYAMLAISDIIKKHKSLERYMEIIIRKGHNDNNIK